MSVAALLGCKTCGTPIKRGTYCGSACSNRGRARQINPDGSRTCTRCGALKPAEAFKAPPSAKGRPVHMCRDCMRARDLAYKETRRRWNPPSGDRPAPPAVSRPRHRTEEKSGLGVFPQPNRVVVLGNSAELCHDATPCRTNDGYALAMVLHEQGCFAPFVRDWFTSVGEEPGEIAHPRFATALRAKMWDQMLRTFLGE